MLHDVVVPMRIDPDIRILREAPVHDGAEHAVHMGITGYPVYHMVGAVIQPGTALYIAVGGFGRGDEGEIADRTGTDARMIPLAASSTSKIAFRSSLCAGLMNMW